MRIIIPSVLFIILSVSIGYLQGIDSAVFSAITGIQTPVLMSAATVIEIIFDTVPLFILSVLISIYLYTRGKKAQAILLTATMAADAVMIYIFKVLVERPRPGIAEGFAFPSGHTATAVVFFGLMLYISNKKQYWLALPVIIIGFSRLYLGVHWLTDVIGGIFLGLFILSVGRSLAKAWDNQQKGL